MRRKVLIVDDEKDILEEVNEALNEGGYECFSATNVKDALAILKDNPKITLVVTDLIMAVKTGADLIKEAQAEFERDISFIIMSGSVETLGLDLDKFPFLPKPLDVDELLKVIGRAAASIGDKPNDSRGTNDE
ncbi:MAG: response regulator [Rhodospirillales bacterium]